MNDPLITRYRPQTFDEVVGQSAVVRALKSACSRKDARVFLFSGPAGVGKTTISRLVAKAYGCEDTSSAILEIDAATNSGIDNMRDLQDLLRYQPFGGSGQRAVIIDECQGLSKAAWDSLLKVLEEPPEHVVWCFCTTNPSKVPATVKSRCAQFQLKEVAGNQLFGLLDRVCEQEKITIEDDVASLLVKEAGGSPRQLLSNIVVARSAKSKKEAAELLRSAVQNDTTLELCRFVARGEGSWEHCMDLLGKIEEPPETTRILVANYLAKCLRNAKTDMDAIFYMKKLEAFSQTYVGTDGIAPLLLSLGRALFSE